MTCLLRGALAFLVLLVAAAGAAAVVAYKADREAAVNVPLELAKLLFYKLGFSFT